MKWIVMLLLISAVTLTFGIVCLLFVERYEDEGLLTGVIWIGVLAMALPLGPHYYRARNSYVESTEPVLRRHFRRTIGYLQIEILVVFLLFVTLLAISWLIARTA